MTNLTEEYKNLVLAMDENVAKLIPIRDRFHAFLVANREDLENDGIHDFRIHEGGYGFGGGGIEIYAASDFFLALPKFPLGGYSREALNHRREVRWEVGGDNGTQYLHFTVPAEYAEDPDAYEAKTLSRISENRISQVNEKYKSAESKLLSELGL